MAPLIISIEGNIGSGKSTFVSYLQKTMKNVVFLQNLLMSGIPSETRTMKQYYLNFMASDEIFICVSDDGIFRDWHCEKDCRTEPRCGYYY